jgi:hypothetical protein
MLEIRRVVRPHVEHTNSSFFDRSFWHPGTKAKSRSADGISCLGPGYFFEGRPADIKGPGV